MQIVGICHYCLPGELSLDKSPRYPAFLMILFPVPLLLNTFGWFLQIGSFNLMVSGVGWVTYDVKQTLSIQFFSHQTGSPCEETNLST